jgi:CubicO group peptidase (beta-lactamase class C family)
MNPLVSAIAAALVFAAVSTSAHSAQKSATSEAPGAAPVSEALQARDAAIRAGTFSQVTSVVVARKGRVVHEQYFDDGGADARRNTRSATKTVTAMLAGAAISRGKLSGVEERVMPWFKDKAPRISHLAPDVQSGRWVVRGSGDVRQWW